MKELGLSYQTPRKAAVEADPDEREVFEVGLKSSVMSGCHSSLHRSQRNRRQVEPTKVWFLKTRRLRSNY